MLILVVLQFILHGFTPCTIFCAEFAFGPMPGASSAVFSYSDFAVVCLLYHVDVVCVDVLYLNDIMFVVTN